MIRLRAAPVGGVLFVVSAASGTGKTTLCRRLVEELPALRYAISATTRPPRPGEHDGADYHFLEPGTFEERVAAGRFLEWAEVHGNRYGTPVEELEAAREARLDLILDLDTQGAFQVRERRAEAVLVFIVPPSMGVLEERLRARGQDDDATIRRRLAAAERELAEAHRYDYVVVNDELERAARDLASIVRAERLRSERMLDEAGP